MRDILERVYIWVGAHSLMLLVRMMGKAEPIRLGDQDDSTL